MIKTVFSILSSIGIEVLLLIAFIFTINNFIGNVDKTINADAIGYYDYLPSIFIHQDFYRKDKPYPGNKLVYERLDEFKHVSYVEYGDFKVNKYPVGTALLQSPFFLIEYLSSESEVSGYEYNFHRNIFHTTLFYLFLGLIFFKKVLKQFNCKPWVIIICQILLVFATPITHYANADAGYSHIYSFFAITLFVYYAKKYFESQKVKHFLICCLVLGLIFILRNPNLLVLCATPFIAGSWIKFKSGVQLIFQNWTFLLVGIGCFMSIALIQMLSWYYQTGEFLIYSYQGEGFNFLQPHFIDILLSYQKGLFVYTPILFISFLTILWMFYKRSYYSAVTWMAFFAIITYIFSSWWSWHYGSTYGMRVYIDFFIILFIPLATFLSELRYYKTIPLLVLSSVTIPLNLVQTYQYKEYILHWDSMTKDKYWKIFLKTDPVYKGLIWRGSTSQSGYSVVKEVNQNSFDVKPNQQVKVYKNEHEELGADAILFQMSSEFTESNHTQFIAEIVKHDSLIHRLNTYLIHFEKQGFNNYHKGKYLFKTPEISDSEQFSIDVYLVNDNQSRTIEPITITYLKKTD
jgi:hypothetical protein